MEKITFDPAQIKALGGPLVYCWKQGTEYLYIGRSKHGIDRPFATGHSSSRRAMETATELEIIPCETYAQACALEFKLLCWHNPTYNKQTTTKRKSGTKIATKPRSNDNENHYQNGCKLLTLKQVTEFVNMPLIAR